MGATWKKPKMLGVRPEGFPVDWRRVHACNIQRWGRTDCIYWDFDDRVNYTSAPESRLHPWSVGGRHLAATTVLLDTAWEIFDLKDVEYTEYRQHLSGKNLVVGEKFSGHSITWYPVITPPSYSLRGLAYMGDIEPYFRQANVIGLRNDYVVVQIIRKTHGIEFLVMCRCNRHGFKVKGIFRARPGTKAFLMEAYLSPDCSKLLLKPSLHYSMVVHREPSMDEIDVVEVVEGECPRSKAVFSGRAMSRVVAFDPRYHYRRLVVGNCQRSDWRSLQVIDLDSEDVLCESDNSTYQVTQNLVFSPNGDYLGSLVASPCAERGILVLECILIYDSNDLSIIQRIAGPGSRVLTTLIPTGIFPIFSTTGLFVASAVGRANDDFEVEVVVHSVPVEMTLQNLCRLTAHKVYERDLIESMPLPKRLKDYLLFRPYLH